MYQQTFTYHTQQQLKHFPAITYKTANWITHQGQHALNSYSTPEISGKTSDAH